MGDTTISWTDKTWNPIRGCSRVSEGCRNCYAERVAARFSGPGQAYEGLAQIRKRITSSSPAVAAHARWTGEVRFITEHLADPLTWREPKRVFVNSMSDLFHEKLSNDEIAAVFGVMAQAPKHTFQVLTKRATRMREWFEWIASRDPVSPRRHCVAEAYKRLRDHMAPMPDDSRERGRRARQAVAVGYHPRNLDVWPLPNVWIGVSIENQAAADERAVELAQVAAAVRFYSCEPLLESVDLRASSGWRPDWVIVGCESGPGSRECRIEWLRILRDQCRDLGVPMFLKQARITEHDKCEVCGERVHYYVHSETNCDAWCRCTEEGPETCAPPQLAMGERSRLKDHGVCELPYLDGVQHAAFPEVRR